jgi:rfaE bifunctional protein nucleotidyltransferase chain/domain
MIYKKGKIIKKSYVKFLKDLTKNKKIVFTNGVFDLLHIGHIKYLKNAANNGNCLIVGLNSDSSVKQLNKSEHRPIVNEIDRAEVLSCLYFVDYVIIFNEKTPEKLINDIQPDIYIKGGDYKVESLPETNIVRAYGGQVIAGLFVEGKSSTAIIKKLNKT